MPEEREKRCPFCSLSFSLQEQACPEPSRRACPPMCPFASGCPLLCCPRCGYHFVDEERSWLVRGLKRLVQKVRNRA